MGCPAQILTSHIISVSCKLWRSKDEENLGFRLAEPLCRTFFKELHEQHKFFGRNKVNVASAECVTQSVSGNKN